ncbi:glutathione S-transferase [Nitrobacteraceae bacterium AZCC 2146]
MFVASGLGPFSGQATHFKHYAPEVTYALERYQFEADRHFTVVDARLTERRYLLGDHYTVADMSLWGWARLLPFIVGEDGWNRFPNVARLVREISSRPAAERALSVLKAHEFKTEIDGETRSHMYQHLISTRT